MGSGFNSYDDLFKIKTVRPDSLRLWRFQRRLAGWWSAWRRRSYYRKIDSTTAAASRRSDTVFLFGSGFSLNSMSAAEWEHIGAHDTFGFNFSFYCDRVRVDFHMFRELVTLWEPHLFDRAALYVGEVIGANPCYRDTVFVLQDEWYGYAPRRLLGLGALPRGARVLGFTTASRGRRVPPTATWQEGLVHGSGTLMDTINAAVLLGWKRIVLTGIDLYDNRYFFLDADKTDPANADLGRDIDDKHANVANGLLDYMRLWRDHLQPQGVEIMVYNPRSLLREVLPLYEGVERPGVAPAGAGEG